MPKDFKYYRVTCGERITTTYAYDPDHAARNAYDHWSGTEATIYTVEWYDTWHGRIEAFIIDLAEYAAAERATRKVSK